MAGGGRESGTIMDRRRNLLCAMLAVMLATALLIPLSGLLPNGGTQHNTAAEMYELFEAFGEPDIRVEPMLDIETVWAIEDARSEAEEELVSAMRCGEDEMGYDAETRTFYCTLGMRGAADWPELSLLAKGTAEGVRVAWTDDYACDAPSDAIREGYRYELMAYTQDQYAYIGVVFTGLPIVTIHLGEDAVLGDDYIPARVCVSADGYEPVRSAAQVHLRGGDGEYLDGDKWNYRVEFHGLTAGGKDAKRALSVLGMEADSDWMLHGNARDTTCLRNHLCWQMWNAWNEGTPCFTPLGSEMVELFVQDAYTGVYQLMPRIRPEQELARMGGDPQTDSVLRMIGAYRVTKRPVSRITDPLGGCVELRSKPDWMSEEQAFSLLETYVQLNLPKGAAGALDDAAFSQTAAEWVEIEPMMRYELFMQVCSLARDNIWNNLYIWVQKKGGGYTYMLSPWDMDCGLRPLFSDDTPSFNLWMVLPTRMLELNVADCRSVLWRIWDEQRATVVSDDAVYQWIQEMEDLLNDSGAYPRESERWRGERCALNMAEVSAYMVDHMREIEFQMREIWAPVQGEEETGD